MKMKGLYIILQHTLILFASRDLLVQLNAILQIVPKVEHLTSNNTTFSMADFYVSSLLFKYGILEESPLFFTHERKFQSHHQHLFEILRRYWKANLKKSCFSNWYGHRNHECHWSRDNSESSWLLASFEKGHRKVCTWKWRKKQNALVCRQCVRNF